MSSSGINILAAWSNFKDTLMQIWKSPYMFVVIKKLLGTPELFAREVCKFLKK